jgi:hypothetical protein
MAEVQLPTVSLWSVAPLLCGGHLTLPDKNEHNFVERLRSG